MSSERVSDASKHESAMKAEPGPRREASRDRAARVDRGLVGAAKGSVSQGGAAAKGNALGAAVGNATLASLMGRSEGGRALPPALRAQLEQALGTSLGDVRVHDDGAARAAAESVDAQAFTHGRDIYLGASETPALLAHEVMHVEQQRHASAIEARVSTRGEAAEGNADRAAAQALGGQRAGVARGGAVAGVQRQPTGTDAGNPAGSIAAPGGLSITKRMEITRDVAQSVLLGFLQRVQNVKTPPDLRRSFVVKTALLTLAQKAGGSARFIDVDKFLSNAPTDPVEFARRFAKMLPEIVNVEAVDAVNKLSTEDAPPGRGARIGDLVKKTEPGETGPDASRPPPTPRDLEKEGDDAIDRHQQIQGKPGQDTKTASFDVLRAARIAAGLGQAWKDQPNPQKQPEARSTDAIAAAVKKIAPDALVPAEARGTKDADQYAGADQFARDLAAQIDIALQKGRDSVSMQLGVSFAAVKDRGALIKAVENIIATIRAGFPNNAATVVNIDIKVADKYITRGRVR